MTMMNGRIAGGVALAAALLMAGAGRGVSGQELFRSGQSVQPVFEGWERNADGSFTLLFGYLNRNYEEEPHVPVGAGNVFSPGPADRGQPTHFYPRRQSFVFGVKVPADWGRQELTWTITHNGRTSQAVGVVGDSNWEVDEGVWKANRGAGIFGRLGKEMKPNAPPAITLQGGAVLNAAVGTPLPLTVSVRDDGEPGRRDDLLPRKPPAAPPAEPIRTPGIPSRTGRTGPNTQDMVSARSAYETGLAVSWIKYRGPGRVDFDPRVFSIPKQGAALAGTATTSVKFGGPGTYVIRAFADDGIYTTPLDVTVTVKAAAASSGAHD